MDFSFYILKIATLPDGLRERLLAVAREQLKNPASKKYFTDGVNAGFNSASMPSAYDKERPAVKEAISLLSEIYTSGQYTSCEVNFLEVDGFIHEHTDQSSAVTPTGINYHFGTLVHQWHSVHVPLTGLGQYLFRRDSRNEYDIESMQPGSMYVFNNYAQHAVKNIGGTQRVNMILHFHDPKWASKRKLYEMYNIRGYY